MRMLDKRKQKQNGVTWTWALVRSWSFSDSVKFICHIKITIGSKLSYPVDIWPKNIDLFYNDYETYNLY